MQSHFKNKRYECFRPAKGLVVVIMLACPDRKQTCKTKIRRGRCRHDRRQSRGARRTPENPGDIFIAVNVPLFSHFSPLLFYLWMRLGKQNIFLYSMIFEGLFSCFRVYSTVLLYKILWTLHFCLLSIDIIWFIKPEKISISFFSPILSLY